MVSPPTMIFIPFLSILESLTFEILPSLLNTVKLSLIILFLLEFNSSIEISINDPGDTSKFTLVDLMLLTRCINQSILL